MKKLLVILFFTLGSLSVNAQEALEWHTDMAKAVALSNKTNKPLFLFFTGSDWCGWCIRLQKEVFKTPEFAEWAKKNVILVELDFPKRTAQDPGIKQQNIQLAQMFAVRGYPTVFFANPTKGTDGKTALKPMGKAGYIAGGPTVWLDNANNILAKKT